jgi:hypothetical protein
MFVMTFFADLVPNITAANLLKINFRKEFEDAFRTAEPTQRMPIWMRSFPAFGITAQFCHGL